MQIDVICLGARDGIRLVRVGHWMSLVYCGREKGYECGKCYILYRDGTLGNGRCTVMVQVV